MKKLQIGQIESKVVRKAKDLKFKPPSKMNPARIQFFFELKNLAEVRRRRIFRLIVV